jgi:hypothetical protein
VAEKNKQLSAEQKRLQQQLEGYAKQNIEHEEKNAHCTPTVVRGRETKIG